MSQRANALNEVRAAIRESYITMPDDSHGHGYVNSGLLIALRRINTIAGDVDSAEPCSRRTKAYGLEWCEVHKGPFEQSMWACGLAEKTWLWAPTRPGDAAPDAAPEPSGGPNRA